MRSDKYYADIHTRIARGMLSYSPETAAAIDAHARVLRGVESDHLLGRAVRALGARLKNSFTKTPAAAPAGAD